MKKIIGLLIAAIVCIGVVFGINQNHKSTVANNDISVEQSTNSGTEPNGEDTKDKPKDENGSDKDTVDNNKAVTKEDKQSKEVIKEGSKSETPKNEDSSEAGSNNGSLNKAIAADEKKEPEATKPDKKEIVTISINAQKAIDYGIRKEDGFSHLPSNGVILGTTKVNIKDGDNVFDVLSKVVRENNVQMEYTGAGSAIYIQGIDNLYEFDCGKYSGWMYEVNGVYPNYGVGAYKLKAGDKITFNYTCDLGKDLGAPVN